MSTRLDAFTRLRTKYYNEGYNDGLADGFVAGSEAAIQPIGEWVTDEDGRIHCTNCERVPTNKLVVHGVVAMEIDGIKEVMVYCPHCGAYMAGLPEESGEIEDEE